MPFLTLTYEGAERLKIRLEQMQARLVPTVAKAMDELGKQIQGELEARAPRGRQGGPGVKGDAPGKLANSFSSSTDTSATSVHTQVKTSQPGKVTLLRSGTGLEGPRHQRIVARHLTKRGRPGFLDWPGAAHPVRSVRGMKKQDFVTPILEDAKEQVRQALSEAVGETLRYQP